MRALLSVYDKTGLAEFAAGLVGVDVVLGENDVSPTVSVAGGALVVESAWRGTTYTKTLVRVAGGVVEEVYAIGTFLGVVEQATFGEAEVRLGPGDLLVAYTDGLCEQENANKQAFGLEGVEAVLRTPALGARGAAKALEDALAEFAGDRPLDDDVCILCVECANREPPQSRGGELRHPTSR